MVKKPETATKRRLTPPYRRERAKHRTPVKTRARATSSQLRAATVIARGLLVCGIITHRHANPVDSHGCMLARLVQARRLAAAMALYEHGHKAGCLRAVVPDEAQAHCDCGLLAYVSEAKTYHNSERGM